jgi:hypothetical protein
VGVPDAVNNAAESAIWAGQAASKRFERQPLVPAGVPDGPGDRSPQPTGGEQLQVADLDLLPAGQLREPVARVVWARCELAKSLPGLAEGRHYPLPRPSAQPDIDSMRESDV